MSKDVEDVVLLILGLQRLGVGIDCLLFNDKLMVFYQHRNRFIVSYESHDQEQQLDALREFLTTEFDCE